MNLMDRYDIMFLLRITINRDLKSLRKAIILPICICFYNVVYTKEWMDKLSYTEKGFQKFEPE